MRSLSKNLVRSLLAFALLAPAAFVGGASPVSAAALGATGACATGAGNGGGQGIICEVTIVNTINATGGFATVTVHQCLGAADFGSPDLARGSCSTVTTHPAAPVTSVIQCDGSVNGAGSTLYCTIVITNNFLGVSPGETAATVDQCVGSGGDGNVKFVCDPVQSTTDAAITQCNGSATGGGASVTCSATGMMASALAVTVDQCNGSAGGGGALIVCSASITNNALPAATAPPASTSRRPATTATADAGSSSNSNPLLPLMLVLAFGGFVLAAVVTTKRSGVRI
jgi:hypothetical protein